MTIIPSHMSNTHHLRQTRDAFKKNLSCALPYTLTALLSVALMGCGSDSDSNTTDNNQNQSQRNDQSLQGIWLAPAYGDAMVVSANRVEQYQYVDGFCQLTDTLSGSEADLSAQGYVLLDDTSTPQLTQQFGIPGLMTVWQRFQQADTLPSDCQPEQRLLSADDNRYQFDASQELEVFIATFEQLYPSFQRRQVDWQALAEAARTDVAASPDVATLFGAMAAMITPLQDSHVEVRIPEDDEALSYNVMAGLPFEYRLLNEFIETHGEISTEQQQAAAMAYLEQQTELMNALRFGYASNEPVITANDSIGWYQIDADSQRIGVLVIDSMEAFASNIERSSEPTLADVQADFAELESIIANAIHALADSDAMIVDIRHNNGGYDEASQLIARHFMDTERLLYSKQARLGNDRTELVEVRLSPAEPSYLKPVVLLTSNSTESAAEVFTLAMSALPQVTRIGETTQGALADVVSKQLPSGIEFDLVTEYYLNSEGAWLEGSGIAPAIEVPFSTLEQRQQQRDSAIEHAWQLLTQ